MSGLCAAVPLAPGCGRSRNAAGPRRLEDARPYVGREAVEVIERFLKQSYLERHYGVTTKRLNEQVRRNRGRFPADFMFQLSREEVAALRSQCVTSKTGRGGRRYAPYAFTEHGAIRYSRTRRCPVRFHGKTTALDRLPSRGGGAGVREAPAFGEIEGTTAVGAAQGRGRHQPDADAVRGVWTRI